MLQTDLNAFIDLLEVFRLGLHTGVLERQIVVEWADQLVMQEDTPNYFLIELALSGRKNSNDFIRILDEHIEKNKPEASKRVILGLLLHRYKTGQITLQKAVQAIDWLAININYSEEEHSFMAGVDDDYNLVNEGICGTFSEIETFLLQFLGVYQEFNLENRQDWQKLNDAAINQVRVLYQHLKLGG